MTGRTKVLLISIGFVTARNPSDKQFVSDLIQCVDPDIDIALWALNDAYPFSGMAKLGYRSVPYKSQNRIFHSPLFEDGESNYRPHAPHSNLRNSVELSLSIAWFLLRDLRGFIESYKPDVVHLTDSIGPVTSLLKAILNGIPLTMTKPTMRTNLSSRFGTYKAYVASSIAGADAVVTFTRVSADQMGQLNRGRQNVEVIPWGVFEPRNMLTDLEKSEIRCRYGCGPDDSLIVIAKRSSDREFKKILQLVHAISGKLKAKFVVAMKPTRFSSTWLDYSHDSVVVESGPSDFYQLLEAADALFCPVGGEALQSSSLLPLTWLEGMVRSTPVITRNDPGVEDLIVDDKTGMLYASDSDLEACFLKLEDRSKLLFMQSAARERVLSKFNLKLIASRYSSLWKDLVGK